MWPNYALKLLSWVMFLIANYDVLPENTLLRGSKLFDILKCNFSGAQPDLCEKFASRGSEVNSRYLSLSLRDLETTFYNHQT